MLLERLGQYLHNGDLLDPVELQPGPQEEHLPVEEAPSRDEVRLRQVMELLAEELLPGPDRLPAASGSLGPDCVDESRSQSTYGLAHGREWPPQDADQEGLVLVEPRQLVLPDLRQLPAEGTRC